MLTRRSLLAGSAVALRRRRRSGPRRAPADKQAPGLYRYKIGAVRADRAL